MAPKRKEGFADEMTGREKKKIKMTAARTIAVQPVKTASFSENAVAGPSSRPAVNSLNGLPSAIDVERFAEVRFMKVQSRFAILYFNCKARAFEIDAMHTAMKNASASSTSRAWQALPRHLRRRAASHDVRRVPLRLREKARAEAIQPTEKSFRPSHRASIHGSIIHDASYHSILELKGIETLIKRILDMSCDPNGPGAGSKRYTAGSRALETYIYKSGSYPFGLISPLTVIWKPLPLLAVSAVDPTEGKVEQAAVSPSESAAPKRKRKTKKKGKEKAQEPVSAFDPEAIRVVWLAIHPSAFQDALASIQTSASLTLEAYKRSNEGKEAEVEIVDLRGQVNMFEIMGPKSNQVLRGALSPVPQDNREDFRKFWARFTNMQTSSEMSRGTVVGFKVVDPRLKFPPKNAKAQAPSTEYVSAETIFPSSQLAQSDIWDDAVRTKLAKPRYKKKDLDERRSKLLIPGTPLSTQRQDDRIPALLIQRSLQVPESKTQGIHGWTLIIPAGWSMAFWSSLTFTGTRVGGQRERQTQSFESGAPYFPRDLPTSTGYDEYATSRAKEERARWDRKPPAKRPNYEKLGTSSPWRADWHGVLGIPRPRFEEEVADEEMGQDRNLVSTQREQQMDDAEPEGDDLGMWLLRGADTSSVVSNISKMFNPGAGLLLEINHLRSKRGLDPLAPEIKADDLMKRALLSVRIMMCKRGAPDDLAIIYRVTDDETKRWEKVLALRNARGGLDEETEEEAQLSSIVPLQSSIIGYVTTGHFSLSQGQGFAIGAVPLVNFLELQEQSVKWVLGTVHLVDEESLLGGCFTGAVRILPFRPALRFW
ncbi:hypothetical protein H0H87_005542 [Tephrocybe sp. NHM501043]|nr:hypothetical protein H0H87_005542 [Tephrocybe sp. NHM501043]